MGLSIPSGSSLRWLLQNLWLLYLVPNSRASKLNCICSKIWPQYSLFNQSKWGSNCARDLSIVLDLHNYFKLLGNWKEMPYIQVFSYLHSKPSLCSSCSACCPSLYNPAILVTWSFFSTLHCLVFPSPFPSFLTWPSSGSCSLWTLADVSAFDYAFPQIYNKPLPPPYLGTVMLFLLISFFTH